jgi:hypothetical protein
MTVSSSTNKFRYEGNGVTDTFAFTGRIFSAADLVVEIITRATDAIVETLTMTTDYTVTINGEESSSVVVVAGKIPSSTQDIQVRRVLAKTQTVDLPTGTVFSAASVENALDKTTALVQDLAEEVARSVKVPANFTVTTLTLTDVPADGYGLVWDGTSGDLRNTTASLATLEGNASTVAANIANVNIVAAIDIEVTAISAKLTEIEGVYAKLTEVEGVYDKLTEVEGVYAKITEIDALYALDTEITALGALTAQITTLGALGTEITSLGALDTELVALGAITADIETCADNIGDIQDVADALAASIASGITYDPTTSGLTATDVQEAIDELASEKLDAIFATEEEAEAGTAEDKPMNALRTKQAIEALAPASPVSSVAGKTGAVTLDNDDVGLGNVANVNQQNASNLTSGTVATARLGSGTANSTTYLRGDGTWNTAVALVASGAVGSYALLRLTTGGTINNNATRGSDLKYMYWNSSSVFTEGGAASGTWRNVSGNTITTNLAGLFQRIS